MAQFRLCHMNSEALLSFRKPFNSGTVLYEQAPPEISDGEKKD